MNIVTTAKELTVLCERVRSAPRVGLDTEFHAERTYSPRLMVIQFAFEDGAAIVDPLALADLTPLAEALHETTVVGHALSSDLKIFADRFDRVPQNVFDTQMAAAFLGYGMQISLAELVRSLFDVKLTKSQTVSDWSTRPLTEKQIEYLVDDVIHLLPMHDELSKRLRELGRYEWAIAECTELADIERYRVDERRVMTRIPGSSRMSRRELGVLVKVLELRDGVARHRNLPPKYIIPDDVVASLATLRPKRVEELAQLRRLDTGSRRALGDAIVQAVARGEALPENELPEKASRPLGVSRETLATLMGVLVGEIARASELPQSLLVSRNALERVAREVPRSRDAFERALDLTGWRLDLVGEPLWRLFSGQSALRVEGAITGDPKIETT